MKTIYSIIIILSYFTQFFIMSPSWAQKISHNENILSPRSFCQNTKGIVSETGIPHVSICCYTQKKKCVINNEQEGLSRTIQFTYVDNNISEKEDSQFN